MTITLGRCRQTPQDGTSPYLMFDTNILQLAYYYYLLSGKTAGWPPCISFQITTFEKWKGQIDCSLKSVEKGQLDWLKKHQRLQLVWSCTWWHTGLLSRRLLLKSAFLLGDAVPVSNLLGDTLSGRLHQPNWMTRFQCTRHNWSLLPGEKHQWRNIRKTLYI